MTDFLSYFSEQLKTAIPCNGSYLGELTFEQAVEDMIARNTPMIDPETFRKKAIDRNWIEETIKRKIQEWKEHEGERFLFFMVNRKDKSVEIVKCWESQVQKALSGLEYLGPASQASSMPRFKEL